MKITLIQLNTRRISFNKGIYQNSKYQYDDIEKDIFELSNLSHTKNCEIDTTVSSDEEIEKYSREQIRKIIPEMLINTSYEDDTLNSVSNAIKKGGTQASYLEMLMELIEARALSNFILFSIPQNTTLNKNVQSDIEKLYDAYINKKDTREVFCPEFKDISEAKNKTTTGDVFILDNEPFIKINSKDGIKNLFITKDTYLELFSPVERFSLIQSREDCYLVSAFDSIYQNPLSRDKILEMFSEDDDGVNVSFKNGYKLNNISKILNKALFKDINEYAYQTEALRAIEALWAEDRKLDFHQKALERYKTYSKILQLMDSEKELSYGGFVYTKDEVETFLKFAPKKIRAGFADDKKSCGLFYYDKHYSYKRGIANFLSMAKSGYIKAKEENNSKQEDEFRYTMRIFERYMKYMNKHKLKKVLLDEVFPMNVYLFLNNAENFDNYIDLGGRSSDILNRMGIDNNFIDVDSKDFKNFLKQKDFSNYILTASTGNKEKNDDEFFFTRHLYSLEIEKSDDELLFKLRDPNNSIFERTCNMEEFKKYISFIDVAKI